MTPERIAELKRLAEVALRSKQTYEKGGCRVFDEPLLRAVEQYEDAMNPAVGLDLIAAIEHLTRERDELKAFARLMSEAYPDGTIGEEARAALAAVSRGEVNNG